MDVIRVGAFELHPSERRLSEQGRAVEIGARAFDLLLVLVENAGRLVPKATLLERVWPRLVVDENNLPAQIAGLRRILGAGAIRTVPGFGYRLELPICSPDTTIDRPPLPSEPGAVAPPQLAIARRTWPERLAPLVGREQDARNVEAELKHGRLVTVVGTPGVGKTRLAEEILARESIAPTEAAAFVSLATLDSVARVPPAIALALGLSLPEGTDPFEGLHRALGAAPLLLVLDSVEHLAEPLAPALAALLSRHRGLRLLVTSQAPLGIAGERVYRLGALAIPADGSAVTDVAACSAVALFAQRAAAADRTFALTLANAGLVAEICRRLDGNPLALELAAARIPSLGVAALHERLDDRFRLLKASGHSTPPRHGALHTAFEWSHGLLTTREQRVFNRLGAFAGSFTLSAAAECVADEALDTIEAIDLISRLVDRSLVSALPTDPPRYVLLETARYYALERLAADGALDSARRRTAAAALQQMDVAYQEYWSMDEAVWLQRHAPELPNVRAAIDWAAHHDRTLAIALYGSAWPLYVEAELLTEARSRYEQTVRLHTDTLPRARLARYWEAVATYNSTRQCDRARYAAELAAQMHAEVGDSRSRYYALMLRVLNWRIDGLGPREALAEARALENATWPPRLLTHGAMTEGSLLLIARDFVGARDACRRAVRLALTVSERLALAATVRTVELDLACGDTAAALQLARPLALSLRHSSHHATRMELLTLTFSALLLSNNVAEARATGAELHALGARMDPGKLYTALDGMAWLAHLDGRIEVAMRISHYADTAHEAHGTTRHGPIEGRLYSLLRTQEDEPRELQSFAASEAKFEIGDEADACALALGLKT